MRIHRSKHLFWVAAVGFVCQEEDPVGRSVIAFSFASTVARVKENVNIAVVTTTRPLQPSIASTRLFPPRIYSHQLNAYTPTSNNFFFSEDDETDDSSLAAEKQEKVDTRMVNGSWSNKNQFPSQNFPKPAPQEEPRHMARENVPSQTLASVDNPSFLSVDGNGTGGLMRRSKGTGGANPSLMVPSDVNPNMRMATPIDSGLETRKLQNATPSTVASYAALSALTRTTNGTTKHIHRQASASAKNSSVHTSNHRRLVPFDGKSLMDTVDALRNNDNASHNIKVKRFRGEKSVMNDHREGFSKPEKHRQNQPLDSNHHVNVEGTNDNNTNGMPSSSIQRDRRRQHPQQHVSLPSTRLVPFKGSSLMEEFTRPANDAKRRPTSKLVKFEGYSMMENQRLLQQEGESNLQSNMLQQSNHKLVPYHRPPASSHGDDLPNNNNNNGAMGNTQSKMVLYNKKAAVASSVVHSPKREYYYVQFRPPTDATMARKTGLQVNTPISLWNERDKFIDS
ncbi:hypothetical protein IV203_000229 [Nitzschia inconspicua]|uniref:Uncharacterized protein n=1 Tax=Nitzschia inconspicua TaxID=303405 RepID=A0A9K3PQG0_9STRA|nr:hypothetical protein IV203_000229 [Nitzschia inconspicua]